jgi:hypothetical protein
MKVRDPRIDPQPANQPWVDRSMTAEELQALRTALSKMTQPDLVKLYDAGLHMCRLANGIPPRAAFIQQLVQAWRELVRRQKKKVEAKNSWPLP